MNRKAIIRKVLTESKSFTDPPKRLSETEQLQSRITELEAKVKRYEEAIGLSEPWNVLHVLDKLADATDFLLNRRNYDQTGWEEVADCVKMGREYINRIEKALNHKE